MRRDRASLHRRRPHAIPDAPERTIVRERMSHGADRRVAAAAFSSIHHAHHQSCTRTIMNFRTSFLFKPFLSAISKPAAVMRRTGRDPAVAGATLSRHDLRRMVADMID